MNQVIRVKKISFRSPCVQNDVVIGWEKVQE